MSDRIVRDTVLTINTVEPNLIKAIRKHGEEMGIELKGIVLIDKKFAAEALERDFPRDTTGFFKEIFCNLDDLDDIQRVIKPYTDSIIAATCRHEHSMHLFRNVIPFIPYVLVPTESSLLWSMEKPLMRDRLSNYDRSLTPKYQYLEESDIKNVTELIKDFTFPVIVKPSGLAASLLVTRCETQRELDECLINTFASISKIYSQEHRSSKPSVLVEEFMVGDMYSTDAYVNEKGEIFCLPLVKVITGHAIGLPGFYSYRHIIPTGLTKDEVEAAFSTARSSIRALNLRSTTTHIELFYTPDGWKIIELGARIGGYRSSLYREAYGVDHFYNDIAVHLGKDPVMPGAPISHAAGFNIYTETEGIVESIEGFEEARKLESVVDMHLYSEPGDEVLFANNGGWFSVDGILSNTDPEKLEEDMAKIRELVKINVRPKRTNAIVNKRHLETTSR